MKFYNKQHEYYCGIDLHAKTMYICIQDKNGKVLVHRNIRACPEYFLKIIKPYRKDIVVAVECMFCWYWLADICKEHGIKFVLGHALYMKAIHACLSADREVRQRTIGLIRQRLRLFSEEVRFPLHMCIHLKCVLPGIFSVAVCT